LFSSPGKRKESGAESLPQKTGIGKKLQIIRLQILKRFNDQFDKNTKVSEIKEKIIDIPAGCIGERY
jgi:hypothetical protein